MAAPNLTFIAAVKQTSNNLIPVEDIPDDVKEQAEAVFELLKSHTGSMETAPFDTKADLLTWEKQIRSYGEQRMKDGKPAPIYYRRSPWKGAPETAVRFRITDTPQKNKAVADGIKDAAEKVTAAAKKSAASAK